MYKVPKSVKRVTRVVVFPFSVVAVAVALVVQSIKTGDISHLKELTVQNINGFMDIVEKESTKVTEDTVND